MSTEILGELDFLLRSMLLGAMITFLYDTIRVFRRVVRHNGIFVSAEDLAFWIFCSICIFDLLYRENNGMLRWFVIMGAAAGMGVYKATIGRFFVKYVSLLFQKIFRTAGKALHFLTKPLRRLSCFLKKQLTKAGKMFKMILCKQ